MRIQVASRSDFDDTIVQQLSQDSNSMARYFIAHQSNLVQSLIQRLSQDENQCVRNAIKETQRTIQR